ncbi:MAG: bacterioferritin-associated ferredoxin [Burkholderiales bacterium]
MYICICNGVTEREIRESAADGVATLPELERCLGVGIGCGRCRDAAAELLRDEVSAMCAQPA